MKSMIKTFSMLGAATAVNIQYTQEQLETMLAAGKHEPNAFFTPAPCQYTYDNALYSFVTESQGGFQTYTADLDSQSQTLGMTFSLCQNFGQIYPDGFTGSCIANNYDYYAVLEGVGGTCEQFSTTNQDSMTQSTYKGTPTQASTFSIQYSNGDGNNLNVGMICPDPLNDNDDDYVIGALVQEADGSYTTTYTGNNACPVYDLNAFFQFVEDYTWFFAIALMLIGIPFLFAGRKLFSCIVFVVGVLITVSVILILFYATFLTNNTEAWVFWLVFSLTILAGLAVGFVLFKCQKLGAACIAGWGGFLGGLILNTAFLGYANSEALFWITNITCALVAAALAFCFYFPVVITVTSFSGAYMFIRGISLFAGGYPNEFLLAQSVEDGTIEDQMSFWFYLYLGFIVALTILGMVVQCKHLKKDQEELGEDIHHPYANRN